MKPPPIISGLDPAALFDMAATAGDGDELEWEPPSLEEAAALFPRWQVLRLLGRGGMGAVYQMHQPDLERDVAVKLLPIEACRDEHQVERFRREARTLAKLRHPGIVALHESGLSPAGHFYFVMEYVDGSTLGELIAAGKVDVATAIAVTTQVCEALAYAHGLGVVHRDIKPSNILLDSSGQAKVADFGLARVDQVAAAGALDLSRTGTFMGTAAYAAPEQVRDASKADHRADIYALGVLLYEMLTGELPRGVFQAPSRKSGSDTHLDDVVRRALQERPEDRYQAAAELKQDITPPAPPIRKSKSPLPWVAALLVIFLAAGGAWHLMRKAPQAKESATLPVAPAPPEPKQENLIRKESPPTEVAKLAPPTRTPDAPAPTGEPLVKVWSLEPLPPSVQPPAALLLRPWKDAVLLATGGVVLHPDSTLSCWSENAPGKIMKPSLEVSAVSGAGDTALALTANGELHRLSPDGSIKHLTGEIRGIFPSAQAGRTAAVKKDGNAILINIPTGTTESLPAMTFSSLAITADGIIWATDEARQLHRLKEDTWIPESDIPPVAQMATGDQLLVLDDRGHLRSPGSTVPDGLSAGASIQAASGYYLAATSSGRCTIWGASVTDGPQRLRGAEGITHRRIGPKGLVAEW